jgi:membrane protease YdiL (CAAX protease family)
VFAELEGGMVRRVDDLKSAFFLSSAFALAAAATVPLLLPSLPPEARSLPLPLPVFGTVLAMQLLVVYGLLGFFGLRLARTRGLEPAPSLTALWDPQAPRWEWRRAGVAFAVGLGCGAFLVAAVEAIQRFLPGTLPRTIHPPGIAAALLASTAGSLGEEILFRLFILSFLLRLLPEGRMGKSLAIGVSALAFAAAHAPAMIFLFGGWQEVPAVSWVWLIALNGLLGVSFGIVFLQQGVGCAILTHLGADVVWHVASPLLWA